MTNRVRGVQLFRQLCQSLNTNARLPQQPPVDLGASQQVRCSARAFAAQAARDLASEGPRPPLQQEQSPRQLEQTAHQNLLQSLQVALSEAHAGTQDAASPERRRAKNRANRILKEFAPLKLVLNAASNDNSAEDLRILEKWERQLKLEWSTVERFRAKYVEESASLRKLGKGSHSAAANSFMAKWYPALRAAIQKEQEEVGLLAVWLNRMSCYGNRQSATSVAVDHKTHICHGSGCWLYSYGLSCVASLPDRTT